jgi:glycosyltransferase involved in cell wall biosynthesis
VSLRIGLNLTYVVDESGGSATYARELVPRLLRGGSNSEITAYIAHGAPPGLLRHEWSPEVRWVRLPSPRWRWQTLHELVGMGLDARRRRLDVVHGLANVAPVVHPGVASVATILDVIWMHHPEALDPRARVVMRTLVPVVARAATRIIAISHAARDDIAATLRLDPAKFDVTPLGVSAPDGPAPAPGLRARLGLGPEPIVLCVAAKRAHKNLDGLLRALALLPAPRPQLVLPGSHNAYEEDLLRLAGELGVSDRLRCPGWISDADLDALYHEAGCFVLPSFQEGFGLPVLEAMARGVPVACSDVPVLAEVAADAAELFDPAQPAAIAAAISRLLDDSERAALLAQRGRERSRRYTWDATAAATLDSYRRAIEER